MLEINLNARLVYVETDGVKTTMGPDVDRDTECYIYIDSAGEICVESRDFRIARRNGRSISLYAAKRSGWRVPNKGFIADYLYS